MASVWDLDAAPAPEVNKIFLAASRGKLDDLKQLVQSKPTSIADMEQLVNGFNSLHIAAKKGHLSICEYILSIQPRLCVSVTNTGSYCKTAAMMAAFEGHLHIIKLLLDTHRDIHVSSTSQAINPSIPVVKSTHETVDNLGNSVLHYACWGGHLPIVTYLIEIERFNHSQKNKEGLLPMQMAAAGNFVNIVQYLVSLSNGTAGLNSESTPQLDSLSLDESLAGFNSFHRAVQNNSLETVVFLLQSSNSNSTISNPSGGVSVDCLTADGSTALHIACKHGYIELCRVLVNTGANVNIQNRWGLTPMHFACIGGYTSIVELLLSSGANLQLINEGASEARPFLHTAAQYGRHEVVEMLINRSKFSSADLLDLDSHGNSAIDLALNSGYKELASKIAKHSYIHSRASALLSITQEK